MAEGRLAGSLGYAIETSVIHLGDSWFLIFSLDQQAFHKIFGLV